MKNIPLLIGTIIGTLLLIVVVAFMFSSDNQLSKDGKLTVDVATTIGEARNVLTMGENNGKQNSTQSAQQDKLITIVEFSDFQCSACKNAAPLVKSVLKAYPNQVRLVYRHFPLDSIHKNARKAAIAAEAVAAIDKNKFFGMHDLLFDNQDEWENIKSDKELIDTFVTYVQKLDIDRTQFLERIEDNSIIELVKNDSNTGIKLGVNATPTFYVNGIKVSAPQLLTTVKSLIVSKE